MLAGPRGTGKKMLVHAICQETGANMFDLTATNLMGKYPGKEGLKLLMHMIFKASSGGDLHKSWLCFPIEELGRRCNVK